MGKRISICLRKPSNSSVSSDRYRYRMFCAATETEAETVAIYLRNAENDCACTAANKGSRSGAVRWEGFCPLLYVPG